MTRQTGSRRCSFQKAHVSLTYDLVNGQEFEFPRRTQTIRVCKLRIGLLSSARSGKDGSTGRGRVPDEG
jgi:hypothetical protein